MLRLVTALALLAATALAQDEEEVPESGDVSPFALEGRIARGERAAPAVFVRLRDRGIVEVKADDTWQEVTLRGLGDFLGKARDDDHAAQLAIGKSGLEDVGHGARASRLFVSLAVEPTIPFQHVQWTVTMIMEQKYTKLELLEGKRSLRIVLPADRSVGCGGPGRTEPPVLKASVLVLARNPQPAKWGDVEIQRPTEVRFRCGDMETADLAEVTRYLRKMRRAAADATDPSLLFFGELRAGHAAPYGNVFDVMEAFVAAEIPCLDTAQTFMGLPPQEIRDAKRLPYPRSRLHEPARDLPRPPAAD